MRTGSTLVHMNGRADYRWYVVPGGVIDDYVAEEIKSHPAVIGQGDGLFPQHDQTWRMRSFARALTANNKSPGALTAPGQKRGTMSNSTTAATPHATATALAQRGIAVFPCQPRGKTPATARGVLDASTDIERINAWWRAVPDLNIGVATGAVSGFWALDVDGEDGEGIAAQA